VPSQNEETGASFPVFSSPPPFLPFPLATTEVTSPFFSRRITRVTRIFTLFYRRFSFFLPQDGDLMFNATSTRIRSFNWVRLKESPYIRFSFFQLRVKFHPFPAFSKDFPPFFGHGKFPIPPSEAGPPPPKTFLLLFDRLMFYLSLQCALCPRSIYLDACPSFLMSFFFLPPSLLGPSPLLNVLREIPRCGNAFLFSRAFVLPFSNPFLKDFLIFVCFVDLPTSLLAPLVSRIFWFFDKNSSRLGYSTPLIHDEPLSPPSMRRSSLCSPHCLVYARGAVARHPGARPLFF